MGVGTGMKKVVEIQKTVEISVDIPDDEIDNVLQGFKGVIYSNATLDDVMKHIASTVMEMGCDYFVEGIGNVSIDGHRVLNETFPTGIKTEILLEDSEIEIRGGIL